MSDIIENQEIDQDTVDEETLDKLFTKYSLLTETSVSLEKSYITNIHGNKQMDIAVSLSDYSIEIYKLSNSSLSKVCKLSGHDKRVTELVWCPREENIVYSVGLDGVLKKWDTRCGGSSVHEYISEEEETVRPYECVDVSCSGRVLCAGSRLVRDDAYLVFWDTRASTPLGGYWNCHTDDVTQVKFHKSSPSVVASGSLDGLVNVYDLGEPTEDDALSLSVNTDASVERLAWISPHSQHGLLATMSHQHWAVWDAESGEALAIAQRDTIARAIRRSNPEQCYLVDTWGDARGHAVLLAGTMGGDSHDSWCLRSVRAPTAPTRTGAPHEPQPHANYTHNRQLVRDAHYYDKDDMLVCAGEGGVVSVWGGGAGPGAGHTTSQAVLTGSRARGRGARRHKPY